MPYLRQLVAGSLPRRPRFKTRSSHVGFVVDEVALKQVFSEYFSLPFQSFHKLLHIHYYPPSGAVTIAQIVARVPS
jgi:hypothetical protein